MTSWQLLSGKGMVFNDKYHHFISSLIPPFPSPSVPPPAQYTSSITPKMPPGVGVVDAFKSKFHLCHFSIFGAGKLITYNCMQTLFAMAKTTIMPAAQTLSSPATTIVLSHHKPTHVLRAIRGKHTHSLGKRSQLHTPITNKTKNP